MNKILKEKGQKVLELLSYEGVRQFNEYCVQIDESATEFPNRPKGQPLQNPGVRERIRQLIRGEEVENPTALESTVAGYQLEKAIMALWLGE